MVDSLVSIEEELKRTRADLKLVGRENLHFTVKFLGEVPDDTVKEVDRRLQGLALSSFDVRVKGVGAFPDPKRPRVVWAGVSRETELAIGEAASAFIRALEGVGRSEDHEFHPHITLARVRSPINNDVLTSFLQLNADRDIGETRVTGAKLKSSLLSPSGPTYANLREYALK